MGLVPEAVLEKIPAMGSDPETPLRDTMVHVRLFDPGSNWQWFILEVGDNHTCFGLVVSRSVAVAGQFGLGELSGLQDEDGIPSVRFDPDFEPLTVGELGSRLPSVAELLQEPIPREINLVRDLVDLESDQ